MWIGQTQIGGVVGSTSIAMDLQLSHARISGSSLVGGLSGWTVRLDGIVRVDEATVLGSR